MDGVNANKGKGKSFRGVAIVLVSLVVIGVIFCVINIKGASSVVNGYKKGLLRPDTFNLREVLILNGEISPDEDTVVVFPEKKDYVLFHCTYEDALGIVVDNWVLYDKETGKYYDRNDLPESIGESGPWTESTYEELFYYDTVWSPSADSFIEKMKEDGKIKNGFWYKFL